MEWERQEAGKMGSASSTQRKIKLQHDEIVKPNKAKTLTIAQVGQFINCLVEARNEWRHKSEIVQRSSKIKKALLYKADRSSFDQLCQQLYKKFLVDHKQLVIFFCISSRMDLCVPADLQTLDPTQDMRMLRG